ncbi:MAG: hypothetical protein ACRDYF_06080, partial [Acidimicrobiia bacterium]
MNAGSWVDRPLWSRPDTARLQTLVAIGAGALGISWFGASGQSDIGSQFVFVSLSVFGVYLGMAGVAGWLLGGRRTVMARSR